MKTYLLATVISIICLQCLESRKRSNVKNERKTVYEVYSKHCLPKRTDRLVYRYQNDSHVFVGFDNFENKKVTTIFWKIKESGHGETVPFFANDESLSQDTESLEKSQMQSYRGQKALEFRKATSAENILAATNSRNQRDFIKNVQVCQQSVLTMGCLIEAFARSARKMKNSPCSLN